MTNCYYRVVILRDLVNSVDEVAEGLINHVPRLICANRDWRRSRNMQYARKIAQQARVYGSAIVAETTDEKKAFEIYSFLLSRGLRMHPFGETLPKCDIDLMEIGGILEISKLSSEETCDNDAGIESAEPTSSAETSNDDVAIEHFCRRIG